MLKSGLIMLPRLALNLPNLPAQDSKVLELQEYTTIGRVLKREEAV